MSIEKLPVHYSMQNIPSIYDEEALTALELAARTNGKVNEVVEDQNKLRAETEAHMSAQDDKLYTFQHETIPGTVEAEMKENIENGTFTDEIDKYAGNLTARLDNFLANTPEGSTTMDAEVLDGRISVNEFRYDNIGTALRKVDSLQAIDYGIWGNGYYLSTGGSVIPNEEMAISEPIAVVPGETLIIYDYTGNQYVTLAGFTHVKNPRSTKSRFITSGEGFYEVPVPEGVAFVYTSWQTKYKKPAIWVKKDGASNALKEWCMSPSRDFNGEEIALTFDNEWRFTGTEWAPSSTYNWRVSQAVPVTEGELLRIHSDAENPYSAIITFQNSAEIDNGAVVGYVLNANRGMTLAIVPKGATHAFVRNDVDQRNDIVGITSLKRLNVNLAAELAPFISMTATNAPKVSLPDKMNAVVGDELELFYKGIVNAPDPGALDISVKCSKGNAYKRKFSFTPATEDIGSHRLTVSVLDNAGNAIAQGSTVLNVVSKTPKAGRNNILCIGDSLSAYGQWQAETDSLLTAAGSTTHAFVGSKTVNGVKFEATSGASISHYLDKSADNPFYNTSAGKLDFKTYANTYCSGNIDTVILFLGWNSSNTSGDEYKGKLRSFISALRTDFPSVKILLFGLQVPSADGLGEAYGTNWVYKDKRDFVFNLNEWLSAVAGEYGNTRFVNVASQFDTDYGMPHEQRKVNKRSEETETVGTDGVHPSTVGYMQIADVAYRELMAQ